MTDKRGEDIFINPSLRRPSALRSMVSALLSARNLRAAPPVRLVQTHGLNRGGRKTG